MTGLPLKSTFHNICCNTYQSFCTDPSNSIYLGVFFISHQQDSFGRKGGQPDWVSYISLLTAYHDFVASKYLLSSYSIMKRPKPKSALHLPWASLLWSSYLSWNPWCFFKLSLIPTWHAPAHKTLLLENSLKRLSPWQHAILTWSAIKFK